jgi:hypothetical protein
MKARLLVLSAVLALAAGAVGCAHQKNGTETTDQQNQKNANGQYLTGSYIPQDVERNGPVTNGKNDLRVIDGSEIERSGGADLNQTLRQLGAAH